MNRSNSWSKRSRSRDRQRNRSRERRKSRSKERRRYTSKERRMSRSWSGKRQVVPEPPKKLRSRSRTPGKEEWTRRSRSRSGGRKRGAEGSPEVARLQGSRTNISSDQSRETWRSREGRERERVREVVARDREERLPREHQERGQGGGVGEEYFGRVKEEKHTRDQERGSFMPSYQEPHNDRLRVKPERRVSREEMVTATPPPENAPSMDVSRYFNEKINKFQQSAPEPRPPHSAPQDPRIRLDTDTPSSSKV